MAFTRSGLVWMAAAAMMFGTMGPLSAQEQVAAAAAPAAASQAPEPLSEDELEELVARIALYPDDLVAVICAASLFPLQIVEAERFLEKFAKDKSLKPKESWDGSVISLLNYPEVVKMMSGDLEWTQSLGDALANQQKEVLIAIQQLRDEAVTKKIIKSDDKIQVVSSGDNVIIQSTNPETIYVPQYEPQMLYAPNYPPQPIGYYGDPYPNYYYPTAGFFAAAVTGAVWGAAVNWGDGIWGGNWGGDVDIGCNNCLNNINGRVNLKDVDWKNVDRSKLNFDRNQLANIDRTKIQNGLQGDRANSLKSRSDNVRRERTGNLSDRGAQARDIRKTKLDNPQRRSGDRARAADRPKATTRPAGQRNAANRSSGQRKAANRPSGKPKAGARADRRPNKPTGIGNPDRGKATRVSSNRGRQTMGGGYRGGGRAARPGGSAAAVACVVAAAAWWWRPWWWSALISNRGSMR